MEVSSQLHSPAALPPGKRAPILIARTFGEPHSLYGRFGIEKKKVFTNQ
jgi:hypothetical protein